MLDDGFTTAWAIWIGMFVVVEGKALFNKKKGDTLSEHVWHWFEIDERESNWTGKRIVLVAGLVWLLGHLGFNII